MAGKLKKNQDLCDYDPIKACANVKPGRTSRPRGF